MKFFNLRTHNPYLLAFSVFWFIAFIALCVWQITRGMEKQEEGSRINNTPAPITTAKGLADAMNLDKKELFFQPVELSGIFIDKHFLLDNSIYYDMVNDDEGLNQAEPLGTDTERQGREQLRYASPYCFLLGNCAERTGISRVGYRVFSFFVPDDEIQTILVERGWLDIGADRNLLPQVEAVSGVKNIRGVIMPGAGTRRVLRSDTLEADERVLRVQSITPERFGAILGYAIYPHPVILAANSPAAMRLFAPLANVSYLSAARHYSYAFQWFLMAAVLLAIYIFHYHRQASPAGSKSIRNK